MVPCGAAWLLIGLVIAVEPPEGCPSNIWSSPCSGSATCETMALAGLTCSSVAAIDGCQDKCAEPCCITTTSTTKTSTMTSVTHTETTYTSTETETHTTTSGTSTQTDTSITTSATTVTETVTGSTVTHTQTTLTTSMTTITETEPLATTSAQGAAAKITVRMAVKVEKVEENAEGYEGYMEDPRVKAGLPRSDDRGNRPGCWHDRCGDGSHRRGRWDYGHLPLDHSLWGQRKWPPGTSCFHRLPPEQAASTQHGWSQRDVGSEDGRSWRHRL